MKVFAVICFVFSFIALIAPYSDHVVPTLVFAALGFGLLGLDWLIKRKEAGK